VAVPLRGVDAAAVEVVVVEVDEEEELWTGGTIVWRLIW
jgi:hypothetical protein